MEPQQPDVTLVVERPGSIVIARFPEEIILTGRRANEAGAQLTELLAESAQQLLIDFANVRIITSNMLNKLIDLNRMADQSGGRLALCNLRPDVVEVFKITRLETIISLYENEQDGLASF